MLVQSSKNITNPERCMHLWRHAVFHLCMEHSDLAEAELRRGGRLAGRLIISPSRILMSSPSHREEPQKHLLGNHICFDIESRFKTYFLLSRRINYVHSIGSSRLSNPAKDAGQRKDICWIKAETRKTMEDLFDDCNASMAMFTSSYRANTSRA